MPPDDVLVALGVMLFRAPVVGDAAGAGAAARALLDAGADGIKVFPVQPSAPFAALTDDTIRAAVDEAHRHGKPTFAHPTNAEGLLAAVRAGIDVVAHTTPQSGPWDDAVLAAIEGADVTLIPTLKVWQHQLRDEPASVRARSASTSTGQLRAWRGAGGTVVFGTDAGGMNDYDPSDEHQVEAAEAERMGLSVDALGPILIDCGKIPRCCRAKIVERDSPVCACTCLSRSTRLVIAHLLPAPIGSHPVRAGHQVCDPAATRGRPGRSVSVPSD